jgi:hypothetical protein
MARLVRKCSQCGSLDNRKTWASHDDAAREGAMDERWTCSSCAWSEFELVEEQERESARA